jgi:hypothetical protein
MGFGVPYRHARIILGMRHPRAGGDPSVHAARLAADFACIIPAQAGIQPPIFDDRLFKTWIPACAGMTWRSCGLSNFGAYVP